jgi:predicted 3-demethylubiquinone-9 3-methyltransferase (glyoxalase superfamily)
MSRIIPHLWYSDKAEEAAAFYASILPNSKAGSVTPLSAESPSGPPGSVKVVESTLIGRPFMAISAGPLDPFDGYWDALSKGDRTIRMKDCYGPSWQMSPKMLGDMKDPDRARAKRVAEAMLKMVKLDIAGLKKAYDGH